MKRSMLLVFCGAGLLAGCDSGTEPTPVDRGPASHAVSQANPGRNDQEFDVRIETQDTAGVSVTQSVHVERRRGPGGWRTLVTVAPSGLLRGLPGERNEIQSLEFGEDGSRAITTRGGARRVVAGGGISLKHVAGQVIEPREIATLKGGGEPFDFLKSAAFSRGKSAERLAQLRARAGDRIERSANRLTAIRASSRGQAKFEYDAQTGLIARATGPASDGATVSVEYGYRPAGDSLVQTSIVRSHSNGRRTSVSRIELSNIRINGKEIIQ